MLPYVENGTIILIGATTENPFFEINSPLLSRMKVIRLEHLTANGIKKILERAPHPAALQLLRLSNQLSQLRYTG